MAGPGRELLIAGRVRPRARSPRGEGDRLRREILDKTARLLAKTGDEEAVSIRAVATAVGVTPPSIYLHFADKDELIRAVCEETFELCDHFVEQRVNGIDDPLAQLEERGRAYVEFGVQHPEHYRVMFMGKTAGARTDPEDLLVASGFAHLLENVHACIATGSIDARHDPIVVATGLWTVVHGITSLAVSVPDYPVVGMETLLDHMLDVYCAGLAGS